RFLEDITLEGRRLNPIESHFQITINGLKMERIYMDRFMDSNYFPITKTTKKGEQRINARPLVKSISYTPPYTLNLIIKHISGPEIRPIYIIKEIFHLSDNQVWGIKILKTKQVMG
ncbi:hypothetical protein ACFL7M_04005, partial [Thermodesulfobacteriota bacterium]